jgi:cytochrome c-type biogenesis protein CcmH/NrfG
MSYFEKNLKALEKRCPGIARMMKQEMDTSHIEVRPSKKGMPTVRITTPHGERVIVHDEIDPSAKAEEHVKKLDLSGKSGSVLLGFGLGYLALEIVKAMEEGHLLIICEADPALFRTALEYTDLERVFETTSVKLLLGNEIDIAPHIFSLSMKYLTSKISVITFHPSLAVDPEVYNNLYKKAQEAALLVKVNANTILYAGREMAGNILANTMEIIRSAGIGRLFNKFRDIPAIIVGAGPSLEKNVVHLQEVREKAVIIAADRTLGLLLPLGITPHLVPSIDYSRVNYDEKYASLQMSDKLYMVFSQTLHHNITKKFWGGKFVLGTHDALSTVLSYYWGEKGYVPTGLHVGHLAFCLANAMGCNPIILTGMDLAFSGDKVHAEDIETRERYVSSDTFASEGIFGEMLQSDAPFRSFVFDLNRAIRQTQALCIDASEGGAKKEGTKIMRLRDALHDYCTASHPEIRSVLEEESRKPDYSKHDELQRDLAFAEKESKSMKRASESILRIIKKFRAMKDAGKERSLEYIKLTRKAEMLTRQAGGKGRILNMLINYNFTNILFMGRDEIKRIDSIDDQYEKLGKQLDRAETYYKNFLEALVPFIDDIQKLAKRLTLERKAKDAFERSAKIWSDYLRYGTNLFTAELYHEAESAFKKVIELQPDHSDTYYYLGRIYSEQNRFKAAASVLEKALALRSNFSQAKDLLCTCNERNRQWETRCRTLREKFFNHTSGKQDEKETILEAGNFYFRVKQYERAEKEYLMAIDRHPALPEAYYHLGHTYFAMQDFEKGVEALSKSMELAPDNPAIYRDLGLVSINRGLVASAERFLLKAIELKPDDLELKEILGNIYFTHGTYEKAVGMYEHILTIKPDHQSSVKNLSRAYQKLISGNLHAQRQTKVQTIPQ